MLAAGRIPDKLAGAHYNLSLDIDVWCMLVALYSLILVSPHCCIPAHTTVAVRFIGVPCRRKQQSSGEGLPAGTARSGRWQYPQPGSGLV